jgi:uncharacterized membrane protein (UPF0182 family)
MRSGLAARDSELGVGGTMPYVKAALVAILTALAALVVVAAVQVWLTGFTLERELERFDGGGYIAFESARGYINLVPPVIVALAVFLVMFVWKLRSGRAASRAPSPATMSPSPESRAPRQ